MHIGAMGSSPVVAAQTIASVTLSNSTFNASQANAVVGTVTVTMSPPAPLFSGSLSISGVNSGGFHLVGTTLEAANAGTVAGTYSDLNIVATQPGISNSPQQISPTLVGSVVQSIASVVLSNNTFGGGVANAVVGTVTVTMSPASPAFSGSLSITGVNSGGFHLVGTTLEAAAGGTAVGTYTDVNIVATQINVSNSPQQISPTLTGTVVQSIVSISLSNSTFTASQANAVVGTVTVTMSPASPAFSGSLSITGANSGGFHLVGTTLEAAVGGTAAGTYSDLNIVATQSGVSNSPQQTSPTLVGSVAQTIASVVLSNSTFNSNQANAVVGTVTVTMSPTAPAFSGSLSITGANSGGFQLVGTTLEAANAGTATGTYTDINIVATQGGISNSPQQISPTLVGSVAQTIASVVLSNFTFNAAQANAVVGTVTVTMSPASPAFSGTLSVTGANSGGFHLVGTTLEAASAGTAAGTYSDVNIVATQANISNSPQQISPTLTGVVVQTIASVNLSNSNFLANSANAVVGTVTVTMSPASPAFSGTLSITGANSGGFHLVGSTLEAAAGGGTGVGTFADLNIVATQAGVSNSPQQTSPTLTGVVSQSIQSVNLSKSTFTANLANAVVGIVSVTLSPPSPAFAGGLFISGANTGGFHLVGSTLEAAAAGTPAGSYSNVSILATMSGQAATVVEAISPTGPVINDQTPKGTVVATATVTMSDGKPFVGTVVLSNTDGGIYSLTGSSSPYSIIIDPNGPGVGAQGGNVDRVTVTGTQGGVAISPTLVGS